MPNILTVLTAYVLQLKDRVRDETEGAAMLEYGLLAGLIAVVVIVTLQGLGGAINQLFVDVTNALP